MIKFLQILFLIFPVALQAQFTYVLDQSIPVRDLDGNELSMPWAGGLNAAQYNTMDLNNDGIEDLVLFDRTANKVTTFLNQSNEYQYTPEYENLFPDDITNWLLLRDANCDGKKDIFTGNNLGIKVYMNVTEPGENLTWEHFLFYSGFPGDKSEVLLTKGFSNKINLQLQFDDLPAIIDADGDGDLDIFNVRFVGNGTVEYHKNLSMELYGSCDSLEFERVTQRWGDFVECGCGNFAFNGANCPPVSGGRTEHAGGKSLLVLDVDGDSKLDMVFSEADCSNLYFLKNNGTIENPLINSASTFPSSNPVNFLIYPAAFYEDVDFDGKKDLIAIPNIFSKTFLNTNFEESNWFYKNSGSNASPAFSLTKRNLLQEDMIDVGDNSVPGFVDYDGDGDYDMFVSQNTSNDFVATIKLYENTGSPGSPEFSLEDDDIWGFSNLSFFNLKIQFADINSDTRKDLVFTASSFQTGSTRLYYVLNQGNTFLDFSDQTIQSTDVAIGSTENILVTDINKDGLPDLLIGKANGSLQYWRNSGSSSNPFFSLENESFLGLTSTVLRQNLACAVSDFDGDGKSDLAFGDQSGQLKIISNFLEVADASGAITDITFNPLLGTYESKNLGGRTWPTTVNLFNSTKPAIIVGNVLGGISILRHDEGESLPKNPVIEVYPNPLSNEQTLRLRIDRPALVQLFSVVGQTLSEASSLPANEEYTYSLPNLSGGIYILRFTVNNKSFAKRIIIY